MKNYYYKLKNKKCSRPQNNHLMNLPKKRGKSLTAKQKYLK